MRKEFVYSFMALGAIPVVVNAADVQTCDVQASVDGSKVTYSVGKLVPGSYTFSAKLSSKVYGVQVKIAGKTADIAVATNPTAPNVTINFDLTKETDVELELVSTDPGEDGADFSVADAKVILNFDLAKAKDEWANQINALKTTNVSAYDYDDDDEAADLKAADDLKAELNAITDTYENYVAQKLYQKASVPQGKIDALAATIADHQNTQAYNDVNAAVAAIKAKYNTAVAEVKAALIKEAAYLLDAALADLNTNVNEKITAATQASYASYSGKTAVADKATNIGNLPTEVQINNIVNDWKGQGTTAQANYDALHKVVTDLQASLDAVKVVDASLTETFASERATAQKAIDDINTKVENVKNTAAQNTLDVTADKTAAETKINTLAGKVNTANAEYTANQATLAAIQTLQDNLNAAKTAVNALKSADGQYEAKNYYDAYVTAIQTAITTLSVDAGKAYKADGTGTAQTFNAGLNAKTTTIQAEIDEFGGTTEPAVDGKPKQAVAKYDALQTAMADYKTKLDAARNQVKDLAVYTDEGYDYETKFNLIQKRINDIKKAITAAQEKKGAEHWTAMLAIDADAAITADIATLLANVQADQNQYDADLLKNGLDTLDGKITTFNGKAADASVYGADVATFKDVENGIEASYNAVKNAKDAINPSSETADYTAIVNADVSGWATDFVNLDYWSNYQNQPINGLGMVEHWCDKSNKDKTTGNVLHQTLTDVPNGTYSLEVFANAVDQSSSNVDKEDIAFVFANGQTTPIKVTGDATNAVYKVDNVVVADGILKFGINKAKGGTNWHSIQIKSLKANTASLIQGWGAKVTELNAQQATLEKAANAVAAKVTANGKAKSDLATSIDGLQDKINKAETGFKDMYKIGKDDSTLGNRGKAEGSVTKEVGEIETALTTLETTNNAVDPTAVTNVNKTDKVGTAAADWNGGGLAGTWAAPAVNEKQMVETYNASSCTQTGTLLSQTITGLDNGIYDVVICANAMAANSVDNDHAIQADATDVAYVFVNGNKQWITAKKQNTTDTNGEFTFNNVIISDGTLALGLEKVKAGTNWHTIQIKSLTYHENDLKATYNNEDPEKLGLNNQYTKLAAQLTALEKAAPGIKTAVENNAKANTAATTALTNLGTYELDNLKQLADVTNDLGEFSTSSKVTDTNTKGICAKKADPKDWAVFRSGLDADKTYAAKKKAIDDKIAELTAAITAANAAETLPYPWTDEITVVTEDDPATTDVNEASSTTYKISEIKDAIKALKTEAGTESDNYNAYRNTSKTYFKVNIDASKYVANADVATLALGTGTLDKEFPQAATDLATIEKTEGAGAEPYYTGLINTYKAERRDIIIKMLASLNGRTAVADNSARVNELKALVNKVKAIKGNADANLKKYNEQKKAADDTQTLWNSTYTEIAATDHSSKVQDWLNELDAIQVTLTGDKEAVEANYEVGKSVAEAKDFAAIQASINDVKARQSESYSEFVAADNKAAHESFMGNDTKKGAIQKATEAYQTAVQERAKYSATNEDIKAAVETAAATLDAALYSCPTDIETLTKAENDAYTAVVSPEVFNVDPFNTQALTIEQDITDALNTFKAAVKAAIKDNVWQPKKTTYDSKVTDAKNAIAAYDVDAKKDAFKDVEDLIAAGEAALNAWTLSGVEAAIEGLEDIENMLAADKDAAAEKDINKRIAAADTKYTEVKAYIEGKTIADDVNNVKATKLAEIEAKYDDKNDNTHTDVAYAKTLAKTFAKRDEAAAILDGFITIADNAKTAVDNAIAADVNNTKAYNEMVEAIKPVADKLAEAEAAAAPYKYATSFGTVEEDLNDIKAAVKDAKEKGNAVVYQTNTFDVTALSTAIEATLTTAFGTEKTGLSADITELKNQYNAYVAANGLGETATAYKKDIDDLEAAVAAIAIEDLDKPTDGIQYDEILAATAKLVKLQKDIADKQTELLKANASTANADVLADFTTQIGALETAASLEGNDAWVGEQTVGGKKISEAIAAIQAQIADVKAAIEAEENISFYKDQYQAEIDAIEADLAPVTAAITAKQAQFTANADAYTTLSAAITTLQGKVDAAKAKVAEYKYNGVEYNFISLFEVYNAQNKLTGGVQKDINDQKEWLANQNTAVALTANSNLGTLEADVNTAVQNYLEGSAYNELIYQSDALNTALTNAIDVKYKAETYSSRLWARLIDEESGIFDEIIALCKDYTRSASGYEGTFDDVVTPWFISYTLLGDEYYYHVVADNNSNPKQKTRTSDADYAAQMQTVAAIAQKIADLSAAVDNLGLLGDANEDGKVNVLDYQKVLNMILDPTLLPEDGSDLFLNTDINKNNVVEVGDLTSIVNYILNHNWTDNGYAAARGMMAEDESLTMTQGTNRIAVNLANVSDYTAFQMDLVLPEGMKMVGAQLSDRAGESHKLYSRAQMDGSIRLLASSVTGEAFSGNEGAVLYIDVEGVGTPELLNILFADVNAQTRFFSLGNDATGIDNVSMFESLKAKVFDFGGRMKNRMQKGFNIIRRADGTTQKVVK